MRWVRGLNLYVVLAVVHFAKVLVTVQCLLSLNNFLHKYKLSLVFKGLFQQSFIKCSYFFRFHKQFAAVAKI